MKNSPEHLQIGISSCLIGNRVRYDGEHKRNDWIVDELGEWATFLPLCPELEMGLGVPRESVKLARTPPDTRIRMIGNKSQSDYTELAHEASARLLDKSELHDLDGYILKKDSPSCGLDRVKVYGKNNIPMRTGTGIFASALTSAFPLLPVIEEGRLCDPVQREHFVTRIFGYHRLRHLEPSVTELQRFHQRYKLVLMEHCPNLYPVLGRIAANSEGAPFSTAYATYLPIFMKAMSITSNPGRRINVMHHALGYLKSRVDRKERAQILEAIDEYRRGELPLMAPVKLLDHLIKKFSIQYLEDQYFFQPYPRELGLRNRL